jgi:hypothetical protein
MLEAGGDLGEEVMMFGVKQELLVPGYTIQCCVESSKFSSGPMVA